MPIVFWMLPFFIRQILFVEGIGYSHFPTGTDDKPIQGEKLQLNLHDLVMDFLYGYAKQKGANLWDFNVMGENKARPERRDRPPVTAEMFPLTYGAVETVSTNPMVAYSQLFHNGQPDRNETATINKQMKHHNTYTFTVYRGIDTGLTGTWSAGIQDIVGATTEISVKFSTLWGNTETTITETTYGLSLVVNIPPETTVQVLSIISEEVVNVPWKAPMSLRGYFAGQFEKGGGRSWEYFGIGLLQHPNVQKIDDNNILLVAEGTFHGVTSKTTRTFTQEKRHYR